MSAETTRLGSDRLVRDEARIIVESRADMDGWDVRKFRQVCIHFEGAGYRLSEKAVQGDGGMRYVLEPWPDDYPDGPAREIYYDLAYVEARDLALAAAKRRNVGLAFLPPLVPLIGFLPSGWKLRLHERFGVHPLTATAWSVWVEFAVATIHTLFFVLQVWTGIFSTRYLLTALAILLPDLLVRYGSLMEERMELPGFYEWLFRIRLR